MTGIDEIFELTSGDASASIDPAAGGRISSLVIAGTEVLFSAADNPVEWGCYPMIPFAGRIRHGRFRFDGVDYQLPLNMAPHALHGYGMTSPWARVDDNTIAYTFDAPWPFAGRAEQRFDLTDTDLTITMTLEAIDRQPIQMGWHPWFLRDTDAGRIEIDLPGCSMYHRDGEGIPDGTLVTKPVGPWDDCFTGLEGDPVIQWGALSIVLSASADHWVVYSEREHAVCVEPQTGPPDRINRDPLVAECGTSHQETFMLRWSIPD